MIWGGFNVGFFEAIKTCFRKSFVFRGRACRSEFWYWILFVSLGTWGLIQLDGMVFDTPFLGIIPDPMGALFGWITLPAVLAVSWRRLHDIGRSGWWIGTGFLWFVFTISVGLVLALLVSNAVESGNTEFLLKMKPFKSAIKMFPYISIGLEILWGLLLLVFFCTPSKENGKRFGPNLSSGNDRSFSESRRQAPALYVPQPS